MATFEEAGTNPVYNIGVVRLPGLSTGPSESVGVMQQLFADLLPNKDIVGGQVAQGFVGDVGLPLAEVDGQTGVYEAAPVGGTEGAETYGEVAGLLLLATDAYDGGRVINVVKGGTVKTKVGALRAMGDAQLTALASALGGQYDATFHTIKF